MTHRRSKPSWRLSRNAAAPDVIPAVTHRPCSGVVLRFGVLALGGWLALSGAFVQGQSGNTDANRPTVPQLAAQLSDTDAETRLRAALTLRKLGPAAAPAVAELVKALRDEDSRIAEQAMWTLAFIGSPGLAAVPTLTAMVRDVDEPNRVTAAAVLGLMKPTQAEPVAALIEATRSSDAELRRAAALALGALGAAAMPGVTSLARLTTDQSPDVRQAAVTALGRLGGYAAPALPSLRALVSGDDPTLRGPALAAIQRIEGDLARPRRVAEPETPAPASPTTTSAAMPTAPAPTVQPASQPVTRTGVVLLSQDKPRYTREAAMRDVTGVVVVRVEFRADGRVGHVELVSGLGSGLDEEALRAARSIKFLPARENGQPVTTTMDIKYRFVQE